MDRQDTTRPDTTAEASARWLERRRTVYSRKGLFWNGFGWEQKTEGWHPLGVKPIEAPPWCKKQSRSRPHAANQRRFE